MEKGRERNRWEEMRQGRRAEGVGNRSGKNLTAGEGWSEGSCGSKGQCDTVAAGGQEPDYMGSDHSSSAWQLDDLELLTSVSSYR